MALPDLNVPFRAANGRLFPFGVFRLLAASRKTGLGRVVSLGVLKGYRCRGIDLAFYHPSFKWDSPAATCRARRPGWRKKVSS